MSQVPTPESSWKGLPSWLVFAFLVVGPPVALITFARTITQSPLVVAIIIAGYEVLIFLLRFTGRVWQKLEDSLVDYISGWIKLHVQEFSSGYFRRYCQHLVYEHQVFDVKGLSTRTAHDLELEQVFVELSIDPTAAHQAPADPLRTPEPLVKGEHSIWEYLSSLDNRHLVMIGTPGSGKTTLLKHIALTLAQPMKNPRGLHLPCSFPILLFLRDHVQTLNENSNFSLIDAVQNHMQKKWQQQIPAQWLLNHLNRGRCLILLDGLDEVADASARRQIVDWVQRQMFAFGQNRFVITSRPYGYRDNPLDGVTVLQVHPFTVHQIKRFVQNWYLANEIKSWGKEDPGAQLRAREGAQDLLGRISHTLALRALAVNPLLLTMIATVHRYRGSLPGNRVALYGEIWEVFLGKRQEARGIEQELSAAQKQQVLQPLAYHLMLKGKRDIEAKEAEQVIAPHLALVSTELNCADFLEIVQNTSGLLLERNPGIYGFAHLTFQEYLAAVYIREENLEHILVQRVSNSWWHETIRLYCALADATALIAACLTGNPPSVQALSLALECQQEALKIHQSVRSQLDALLTQGIEDPDRERRRVVGEALLARRIQHMIHLEEETYIDTSLVNCAEYQVFLDEQLAHDTSYDPDHWMTSAFPSGTGHAPVLGVRWADAMAFCEWLTVHESGLWRYRLLKVAEWQYIKNDEKITIALEAGTGYWMEERRFEINKLPFPYDAVSEMLQVSRDRTFDWARDLALARDRARALDLALDRALALDRTRDLALDRDLTLDRALDRTLAQARTLDLDRDINLASARARALDQAIALARTHDFTRNRDLALALAHAFNHTLSFDRAHALVHDLSLVSNHITDLDLDLDLILDLALNLVRALDHLNTLTSRGTTIFPKPKKTLQEERRFLIWFTRYSAYVLARYFRFCSILTNSLDKKPWYSFYNKSEPSSELLFEQLVTSYLNIFVTFTLLEDRIEGRLPAWEGILLVKERTKDTDS
jgi:energy-coupling factor transporter ATP-binding protein EcfA2